MGKISHLKTENEVNMSKKYDRDFYKLYEQAILQELKERGVIDDYQLQLCRNKLYEKE